jgi:hypothetical protein
MRKGLRKISGFPEARKVVVCAAEILSQLLAAERGIGGAGSLRFLQISYNTYPHAFAVTAPGVRLFPVMMHADGMTRRRVGEISHKSFDYIIIDECRILGAAQ